ncbi:MAG: hypothetical protein ACR2P5_02860 [Gammaproteobacteria bacterium]
MSARKDLLSESQAQVDQIELALLLLLYRDTAKPYSEPLLRHVDIQGQWCTDDPSRFLTTFSGRTDKPWLFGWGGDRHVLVPTTIEWLVHPVPTLLTPSFTFALLTPQREHLIVIEDYRAIRTLPRPFHTTVPHAHYFLKTCHEIFPDGQSHYRTEPVGWKGDKYVPIKTSYMPQRLRRDQSLADFHTADKLKVLIAAGFAEHTLFKWRVTVTSETGAVRVVSDGEGIRTLAALRDAPRAGVSQRRSPIFHWVQQHVRRRPGRLDYANVRRHLRGVTHFELGDLAVTIDDPQKDGPTCSECGQLDYPLDAGICLACYEAILGPEYRVLMCGKDEMAE